MLRINEESHSFQNKVSQAPVNRKWLTSSAVLIVATGWSPGAPHVPGSTLNHTPVCASSFHSPFSLFSHAQGHPQADKKILFSYINKRLHAAVCAH